MSKVACVYIMEIFEEIFRGIYKFFNSKKIRVLYQKDCEIHKWYTYHQLMIQWSYMKKRNRNLAEYFAKYSCEVIAVYGIGEVGKLCCNDFLQAGNIQLNYIIDEHAKGSYKGIPIVHPDQIKEDVDAVVITPVYCYLEIAEKLCDQSKAKFISLEDIVTELSGYAGQRYYEKD